METKQCPFCKEDLIDVFLIGWTHMPFIKTDCIDGIMLNQVKIDNDQVSWFECPDPEVRHIFLKKLSTHQFSLPEKLDENTVELKGQEVVTDNEVITNEIAQNEAEKYLDSLVPKKVKKKEFLHTFKPYF